MNLTDFLPYILPRVKGCADVVAVFNIRLAIIELCQKAMIWREYLPGIETSSLQTAYPYTPEEGQQVCTLISASLDDEDIEVVRPDVGKLWDSLGITTPYAYGTFTGIELRPVQAESAFLVAYASVAPSITAMTVPDTFSQYAEDIATGTLMRLMKYPGKDYTDINGSLVAKLDWEAAIKDAKSEADRGFSRATSRTAKVWF